MAFRQPLRSIAAERVRPGRLGGGGTFELGALGGDQAHWTLGLAIFTGDREGGGGNAQPALVVVDEAGDPIGYVSPSSHTVPDFTRIPPGVRTIQDGLQLATPAGGWMKVRNAGGVRLHGVTRGHRRCATQLTLTQVAQPLSECSFELTGHSGFVVDVTGVFDFDHAAAGGGTAVGELFVDGVAQLGIATLTAGRATVTQQWEVAAGTGTKTYELRARKTAAGGTVVAQALHTTVTWRTSTEGRW